MPDLAIPPGMPTLFKRGHAMYFLDRSGERWTVVDCRSVGARLVVVGDAREEADYRVFSARGRSRRCYAFKDTESRDVEAIKMERQILESRVLPD